MLSESHWITPILKIHYALLALHLFCFICCNYYYFFIIFAALYTTCYILGFGVIERPIPRAFLIVLKCNQCFSRSKSMCYVSCTF